MFERLHGEVSECHLMTSYRPTPSITDLFAHLLPESERMEVSSVQRESSAPRVEVFDDKDVWTEAVREASPSDEGLTAVIVPWKHEATKLVAALGNDAPNWLMRRERCLGRDACYSRCRLQRDLSLTTSSFRTRAQDSSPPMIASRKIASTRAFRAPRGSSTCSPLAS